MSFNSKKAKIELDKIKYLLDNIDDNIACLNWDFQCEEEPGNQILYYKYKSKNPSQFQKFKEFKIQYIPFHNSRFEFEYLNMEINMGMTTDFTDFCTLYDTHHNSHLCEQNDFIIAGYNRSHGFVETKWFNYCESDGDGSTILKNFDFQTLKNVFLNFYSNSSGGYICCN